MTFSLKSSSQRETISFRTPAIFEANKNFMAVTRGISWFCGTPVEEHWIKVTYNY